MWFALPLVASCVAPAPQTEPAAPPVAVEARVVRAALFKNGLAYVHREASVPSGARQLRLVDLPPPVHGTFWLTGDPTALRLGPAIARPAQRLQRARASTLAELLRANVGGALTLHLQDGTNLAGTLLEMPESEPAPLEPLARAGPPYRAFGFTPEPRNPAELLLVDDGNQVTLLAASDVRRVSAASGALLGREFERRSAAVALVVELEEAPRTNSILGVQYLTRGLTWAPSYAIDISNPERALLTAKAVVINESEDLVDAELEFVTGFPNLKFGSVVDPIALRGDLEAFFRALDQGSRPGAAVLGQSVLSNLATSSSEAGSFPDQDAPEAGSTVEDLFFYEQGGVSLARGERALYPLFSLSVPYRHVYRWSIPDTIEADPPPADPREPEQEEIWHSLRLENDGPLPWTTAPAMTSSGGRLLGQDTLHYTAPGAASLLRVTRAVEIQADRAEYETGRERASATFWGRAHDLVTVEGRLTITNRKRETVTLEVEKRLQGEIADNPNSARVVSVAEGLRRVNPSQRLSWTIELPAGERLELGYTYTVYLRP